MRIDIEDYRVLPVIRAVFPLQWIQQNRNLIDFVDGKNVETARRVFDQG
jgi:hypothetical protein